MTLDQIEALVATGESETLEFKATTGTRRKAAKTICAMLNNKGGHVLFGINSSGEVAGQNVSERTMEELSAEIQRIEPSSPVAIERIRISDDRQVIVVHLEPGLLPPYQYKGFSYRRVGNTTRRMSVDECNRMLFERMHAEQRWENQFAKGWSLDDLDIAEIRNTVAEAVRIGRLNAPGNEKPEELLRGLGLMSGGELYRAAIVLFGKTERLDPEMPQCMLRVARFRGLDRSSFLDNRQFHGNVFSLLANAERFLRETLPISSRFVSGRIQRIDEPTYPPLAIREALANALCHRDYAAVGGSIGLAVYDDRLEVTSTGPLHFGLAPRDLFDSHESKPWNPLIARTFYRRGIIEEWGRGTLTMRDLVVTAGLPKPEIEERNDCVTVRFRRFNHQTERDLGGGLTEQQLAILTLLHRSDRSLALGEIRTLLGQTENKRRVREDLATLKIKGLAESTGHGRGARWKPR